MAAAEGYRNFLVRHLRMICSQRKISTDGSKEELLHRLADHDSQQGSSPSSIRLAEVMELPEVPPQVHPTAKSLEPDPERQQQLIAEACSAKANVPNSPGKMRPRRMLPVPLRNRARGAKSSASIAGNVDGNVVDESNVANEAPVASTSDIGDTAKKPLLVAKSRPPQRPLLVAKAKAKRPPQPSQPPLSQETSEPHQDSWSRDIQYGDDYAKKIHEVLRRAPGPKDVVKTCTDDEFVFEQFIIFEGDSLIQQFPIKILIKEAPSQLSQEAPQPKDNGLTVFEMGGSSPAESSDAEDMEDVLASLPSTRSALRAAVEESSGEAVKRIEKSDDSTPIAQGKQKEMTALPEEDVKAADASSETTKTIGATSSIGEIATPESNHTKVADREKTFIEQPQEQDGKAGDPSELQLLADEMKACGKKVLEFDLDFALEQHRQEQMAKRLAEIREAKAANLAKQGQLRQALEIARAKMEKSRQAVLERAEKRFQLRQEWEVLAQDPDWASKLEETQEKLRLQDARKLARKQFWEVRASQGKRTATEMGETDAKGPKSKTVLPARLQEEFMAKRSRC